MKCLVRLCPNRTRDGRFIGELCSFCHEALSTDTPMPDKKTLISSKRILATVILDGWAYAQDDEAAQ